MVIKKYFLILLYVLQIIPCVGQTSPSYLQVKDKVAYLQQYGAIANSSSAESATANVAAFNAAISSDKSIVMVTDTFYFNDTLVLPANHSIVGVAGKGTLRSLCAGVPLLRINGSRSNIKDLMIYGAADYTSEIIVPSAPSVDNEDGIFFTTGLGCVIDGCEIRQFRGCGIRSDDTENSKINLSIRNCFIKNNMQNGMRLGGINSVSISATDCPFNRDYNIYIASSTHSVSGDCLELGVSPIINILGLALYSEASHFASFNNLHIEDEYISPSYYVATDSRLPLISLVKNTEISNSYLRPGSGWISEAVKVGPSCTLRNVNITARSQTYPITGITICNIISSELSPLLDNVEYLNLTTNVDSSGLDGYKYYSNPLFTEVIIPYLFECNGSGVASFAYLLPYNGSLRVNAAGLFYANSSSGTPFVDGDFSIGSTSEGTEIFVSTGTIGLENNRGVGLTKTLGITPGTILPNVLHFKLTQRSGQTLRFWVRLSLFN